jgi:Tol biopolymer transport system component
LTGDMQIATDYSCCKWQILPDGEHVVFAAGKKPSVIVHTVPIAASEPPRVLSSPLATRYTVEPYSISPNREWILYETETDTPTRTKLYVAPFAGGESTLLLNEAEAATTSFAYVPPGDSILLQEYYTPTAQSQNFYIQQLPSGERRPIASFQSGIANRLLTSVSPDGRWLLVSNDSDDDNRYELYVVSITDGAIQQLTTSSNRGNYSLHAFWTADSKYVVFQTHDGHPCRVCAAEINSNAFVELDPTGESTLYGSTADDVISADGQYVLVESNKTVQDPEIGNVVEKVEMHKVRIVDGAASSVTPALSGDTELVWMQFATTGNALFLLYHGCTETWDGENCTVSFVYSGADDAPIQPVPLPSVDDRYPGFHPANMGPGVVLQTISEAHNSEEPASYVYSTYVVPFGSQQPILAARFDYDANVHALLSPGGGWLVYSQRDPTTGATTLYATRPGSGISSRIAVDIAGFDMTDHYVVYGGAKNADGMYDLVSSRLLDSVFLPLIEAP